MSSSFYETACSSYIRPGCITDLCTSRITASQSVVVRTGCQFPFSSLSRLYLLSWSCGYYKSSSPILLVEFRCCTLGVRLANSDRPLFFYREQRLQGDSRCRVQLFSLRSLAETNKFLGPYRRSSDHRSRTNCLAALLPRPARVRSMNTSRLPRPWAPSMSANTDKLIITICP